MTVVVPLTMVVVPSTKTPFSDNAALVPLRRVSPKAKFRSCCGGCMLPSPTKPQLVLHSQQDRVIARQPQCVHSLTARDSTGRQAFYVVFVPGYKERAFLAALRKNESFDLTDYGTILASNYGEEPNDAIRQLLKERYGFDL
jgi:hypothetical protein